MFNSWMSESREGLTVQLAHFLICVDSLIIPREHVYNEARCSAWNWFLALTLPVISSITLGKVELDFPFHQNERGRTGEGRSIYDTFVFKPTEFYISLGLEIWGKALNLY